MLKKTGILILLVFSISLLVISPGDRLFAAESNTDAKKTVSKTETERARRLLTITGLTSSQISKYGISEDIVLQIHAAAVVSGSSFQVVYENSDKGASLTDFYKKYSVSASAQTAASVDKRAMADVISIKTGISSSMIMDYGFGSGIPVNDIITCCVIAAKSGNSLSVVIEKRKKRGTIANVYKDLSIDTQKQYEISAVVNSCREEVEMAGKPKGAGNTPLIDISGNKILEAAKLADITGVTKNSIIDAMKKGNSSTDIIKAIAIVKKIGGNLTSILEIKRDGGWMKVNSYYGVGSVQAQNEIAGIIKEINDKIKPPVPVQKKVLVNGR